MANGDVARGLEHSSKARPKKKESAFSMCGIAGVYRIDDGLAEASLLEPMLCALRHRGPDGTGIHVEGPIGIGMTRLAIIDVVGGQQPIFNEDLSIAIVCNGEIYNSPSLRRELEKSGHRFRTHSDVEVILHLYEEVGTACFARLNGMFAVALADYRRQQVVLARDPYGQKPLYIWQSGTAVHFASELKALAGLPGFQRKVSNRALVQFLQFRYVPAPSCILEGVQKLPPGSYQVLDRGGARLPARYFQLELGPDRLRDGVSDPGRMRAELTAAVDRHLMAERPLGVFLSGGLDSSAVVACMSELGCRAIHTYTVGFEGYLDNEFATAHKVAKKFQTVHNEVVLSGENFWEALDDIVWCADEPMADLTMVPLYFLAKQARREVVVVLSGEGSDELLAGYQGAESMRGMFDLQRKLRILTPLARLLSRMPLPASVENKVRTLAGSESDYWTRNPKTMTEIFGTDFRARYGAAGIANSDPVAELREYYASRPTWDGVHLYFGGLMEWWLPDDLLHKADRMTMAHSLESRTPFLDTEFSSYCARLDISEKTVARQAEPNRKIALKRAFADTLPEGIALQPKKGFAIPMYDWVRTQYREPVERELGRSDGFSSDLFPQAVRSELFASAAAGDRQEQDRVWALVVLNKWADRWL